MTQSPDAPYIVRSLPRYLGSFCIYVGAYFIAGSAAHYVALDYFQRWVPKYASPLAQWLEDLTILPIIAVVTGAVYFVGLLCVDILFHDRHRATVLWPSSFCGAVAACLQSAAFAAGGSQSLIYTCLLLTPLSALVAWTAIQNFLTSYRTLGLRRT